MGKTTFHIQAGGAGNFNLLPVWVWVKASVLRSVVIATLLAVSIAEKAVKPRWDYVAEAVIPADGQRHEIIDGA